MFISKNKYNELRVRIEQYENIVRMHYEQASHFSILVDSVLQLHKTNEKNCDHCKVKYPCKTIKVMKITNRKYLKSQEKNATENS
jgi:hypothetical protein